jgi:hypothetical protein
MRRAELSLIPNRVAVPKLALIFLTTFPKACFLFFLDFASESYPLSIEAPPAICTIGRPTKMHRYLHYITGPGRLDARTLGRGKSGRADRRAKLSFSLQIFLGTLPEACFLFFLDFASERCSPSSEAGQAICTIGRPTMERKDLLYRAHTGRRDARAPRRGKVDFNERTEKRKRQKNEIVCEAC